MPKPQALRISSSAPSPVVETSVLDTEVVLPSDLPPPSCSVVDCGVEVGGFEVGAGVFKPGWVSVVRGVAEN